jgi:hypothetical protein
MMKHMNVTLDTIIPRMAYENRVLRGKEALPFLYGIADDRTLSISYVSYNAIFVKSFSPAPIIAPLKT